MLGKLYSPVTFVASLILRGIFPFFSRGRRRLPERYGVWNLSLQDAAWFHGASVGEVRGLIPVIRKFREEYPEIPVLVTAVSPTGLDEVGDIATATRLLPFDHHWWLQRALSGCTFRVFVFGETEIWPGLLSYLRSREVPRLMVNARISSYSYRRYLSLRSLIRPELSVLDGILVSDKPSLGRFIELGADPDRIQLCGNAKYDSGRSVPTQEEALELRARFLFNESPVVVLGSVWPGEELPWLEALQKLWSDGKRVNVLIAPRHLEKVGYFKNVLSKQKISFTRRTRIANTQQGEIFEGNHVVLLDTLGELESCYSFAALGFIGGSMVDVGGHNPLEAAAYGVPLAMGEYVSNVFDICCELEKVGALTKVKTDSEVSHLLLRICEGDLSLAEGGTKGQEIWKAHQGATERILETIVCILAESPAESGQAMAVLNKNSGR